MAGKIDWDALKQEYVLNGTSFVALAEKYKVSETSIRKRSSRNNWPVERQAAVAKLEERSFELMQEDRAKQLAAWNDEDIKLARAMRGRAAQMMMSDELDANTLRSISSVADTAQKIARLAFGVATENQTVTAKTLPTSIHEFV